MSKWSFQKCNCRPARYFVWGQSYSWRLDSRSARPTEIDIIDESLRTASEGRWVRHLFPLVCADQNLQAQLGFKLHPEVPAPTPERTPLGHLGDGENLSMSTSRMKTQILLGDCQNELSAAFEQRLICGLWTYEIDFEERIASVGSCPCLAVNYSIPKGPKGKFAEKLFNAECATNCVMQAAQLARAKYSKIEPEQIVSTQLFCPSRHVEKQLPDRISLPIKINRRQSRFENIWKHCDASLEATKLSPSYSEADCRRGGLSRWKNVTQIPNGPTVCYRANCIIVGIIPSIPASDCKQICTLSEWMNAMQNSTECRHYTSLYHRMYIIHTEWYRSRISLVRADNLFGHKGMRVAPQLGFRSCFTSRFISSWTISWTEGRSDQMLVSVHALHFLPPASGIKNWRMEMVFTSRSSMTWWYRT